MAIVDNAFREWIADFKATNPGVANSRAILDTAQYAFAAGRKAQRDIDAAKQSVGVPPETLRVLAERWASDRWYTGSPIDDIRALIDQPTADLAGEKG